MAVGPSSLRSSSDVQKGLSHLEHVEYRPYPRHCFANEARRANGPDQLCTISHFYMKRIKKSEGDDGDFFGEGEAKWKKKKKTKKKKNTRNTYSRLVTLTVYLYLVRF